MAARLQHQHLHAHHERGYVTEVSIVYVTAGDTPTPPPSAQGGSGAANTAAIGSPLRAPPQVTSASASLMSPSPSPMPSSSSNSSPVYPHRSQRPANQSSSPLSSSSETTFISSTSMSGPKSTEHHHTVMSTSSPAPSAAPTGNLVQAGNQGTASSSAMPTSTAASSSKHGLSAGAGVGVALLVIALVAAAGGLAFWYWRKKQNAAKAHQRLDDEKNDGPEGNSAPGLVSHVSVRRNPNDLAAPRLSLRPVTDMFPAMQEKQATTGAATLAPATAEAMRTRTPEPAPAHTDSVNPFGDDAAASGAAPVKPMPPLGDSDPLKSWPAKPTNAPVNTMNGRNSSSSPTSPSPSVAAGPGGAIRGPPGAAAANNVHRVQLDFKPTMDDELELKAGQLVRMLHEYDDGWALCIRLDRSQQGVIPRNCISKLPVKPRAPGNGPPPGQRGPPSSRPMGSPPMNGPQGRSRAQSNAVHGGSGRPASPGPFGQGQYSPDSRPRSNSSSSAERRITPPAGPSPLNSEQTSPVNAIPARKPVPGQAI